MKRYGQFEPFKELVRARGSREARTRVSRNLSLDTHEERRERVKGEMKGEMKRGENACVKEEMRESERCQSQGWLQSGGL